VRARAAYLLAILLATAAAAACGGEEGAQDPERRVPQGFLGAVVDGPLTEPGAPRARLDGEFELMRDSGVEGVRVAFFWSEVQPYRRPQDVPRGQRERFRERVGGVPSDFGHLDRIVAAAAARGIAVLPTVLRAPAWAAKYPSRESSPPRSEAAYARFMAALVRRYGPSGSFWRANEELPRLPVRGWQIWNEPYLKLYWTDQPRYAPGYVRLLREAHTSIKRADPGARVVLSGLASFGRTAWDYLDELYRAGAAPYFDAVAAHPFTERPRNVITILERMRAVMRRHRDSRTPLLITELSWPSGRGEEKQLSYPWEESERGQARKVPAAIELLARERRRLRIERVYHYNWLSAERGEDPFAWAGLRRVTPSGEFASKPVLRGFRRVALALEGCERKGELATECERVAE
jgi:hypothetical protein